MFRNIVQPWVKVRSKVSSEPIGSYQGFYLSSRDEVLGQWLALAGRVAASDVIAGVDNVAMRGLLRFGGGERPDARHEVDRRLLNQEQ